MAFMHYVDMIPIAILLQANQAKLEGFRALGAWPTGIAGFTTTSSPWLPVAPEVRPQRW